MIAVDTNILVHAHRSDMPLHERASIAVTQLVESGDPWAIPWPCVHEFLAVVTSARVFQRATPVERAREQLHQWIDSPSAALLAEDAGYLAVLEALLATSRVSGPKIHDARIAALCLHHGVGRLWTADRDFSHFAALTTENPLAG